MNWNNIKYFFSIILMLSLCNNLIGQKRFFLEASGNYSSFGSSEEDVEIFGNHISSFGANVGATLYLTKKYSDFIFGVDANYQFDRYRSKQKFDKFDTRNPFDVFTTSAGLNIGYKIESIGDFQWEIILKGGIITNSFVEQNIESTNFQIYSLKPYGQYGEVQVNLVKFSGSGFFGSLKYWFGKKIDSNLDQIFSINDLSFELPSNFLMFKIGYRIGIF